MNYTCNNIMLRNDANQSMTASTITFYDRYTRAFNRQMVDASL